MQTEASRSRHLTQQELAIRWNKSVHTVERYRSDGVGPVYLKIGGKVTVLSRLRLAWCKTQPQAFSEKTGKPDARGAYGLLGQEMIAALTHLQHVRDKHVNDP